MLMEGIILAGGLGARLRSVVSDIPKPMAPVGGKPFLAHLIEYLESQNIDRVILATGYKQDLIADYFGNRYREVRIDYSREEDPLGTGGAVQKALSMARQDRVFLFNGDSLFKVDLAGMADCHLRLRSPVTIALKRTDNTSRFGLVRASDERIACFHEKKECAPGGPECINGGVYCINTDLFENLELEGKFSFEIDFLTKYCQSLNFGAYFSDGYFIDIGIPEDYKRAQRELG